ncbi:hypothetical protein U9M48_030140 [Paspalum notatum var. saurae]|uniref:Phosphoglycerate mutase-like protein AT74H n=1 Tax=Paspalum notatum var. saurae TaxID=547442 RepID=A0AAQ3U0W5_PASNO
MLPAAAHSASSRCPPAAVVPAAAPAFPRRLRCRCSEHKHTLAGVPRRRASHQPSSHSQRPPPLRALPTLKLRRLRLVVPEEDPPPRPRRIVLLRHGESEGNVDEAAYTRVPDPQIGLTAKGWREADDCGRRLRDLFSSDGSDDWKVYFYVSPYRRTLETLRGVGRTFSTHRVAGVREEPRLREQDFGNFQDREQMRVEKEIRLRYGRFFYRFPNGESAADVYDRITGFRETLLADIDLGRLQSPGPAARRTRDMNVVVVSHGLTLRVFLMRWYRWTVEQFEGLNNLPNGGAVVMQLGPGGRYSLLVHHTADELREFGFTDDMLRDQMWQKTAKPGELNKGFMTYGQSFFDPFTPLRPTPWVQ